ncbi:MAG: DUF2079 domain-containing protein [Pseudomonadota bacterium]|nr:MAG: hypothetical protein DIU78_05730 [Pseudomonadota bacterium]
MGSAPRSQERTPLVVTFAALALLGVVGHLRVDDDSFQHFTRSVEQVRALDWRTFATDVWNKPLPGLVYGIPGLLGIECARLASVAITTAAAGFTLALARGLGVSATPAWVVVIFFLAQPPVLRDGFTTMTELPAALLLVAALWAELCKARTRLAALLVGLVPLCRVELAPVTAFVGFWLAFRAVDAAQRTHPATDARVGSQERRVSPLRGGAGSAESLPAPTRGSAPSATRFGAFATVRHALLPLTLAALPMFLWQIAGALVTGELTWFSQRSYGYVRDWDLPGLLRVNVIAGLGRVLPGPVLVAGVSGVAWLMRARSIPRNVRLVVLGIVAIHFVLLNTVAVYPRDWYGAPSGHAVAAINPRNYSPTAPLTALFATFGLVALVQRATPKTAFVAAAALAALVAAFNLDSPADAISIAVSSALTLALAVRLQRSEGLARERIVAVIGVVALVAPLVVRPFFWYPTRWNDRRAEAVLALASIVRSTEPRPARVVQDLSGGLALLGGIDGLDVDWRWPHEFESALDAGALVVTETDLHFQPLPRYSASLRTRLALGDGVSEIRRHAAETPPPFSTFDRVIGRNRPVYFTVYRVLDERVADLGQTP